MVVEIIIVVVVDDEFGVVGEDEVFFVFFG